eukprot:10608202-Karenia_brevis.AAC.1
MQSLQLCLEPMVFDLTVPTQGGLDAQAYQPQAAISSVRLFERAHMSAKTALNSFAVEAGFEKELCGGSVGRGSLALNARLGPNTKDPHLTTIP